MDEECLIWTWAVWSQWLTATVPDSCAVPRSWCTGCCRRASDGIRPDAIATRPPARTSITSGSSTPTKAKRTAPVTKLLPFFSIGGIWGSKEILDGFLTDSWGFSSRSDYEMIPWGLSNIWSACGDSLGFFLQVFYGDTGYEQTTEDFDYDFLFLLCDIGGILGFYLGLSGNSSFPRVTFPFRRHFRFGDISRAVSRMEEGLN